MSRDWRPIEQVCADKALDGQLRASKFVMILKGQEEVPCWNDEARQAFPQLSFLLNSFETVIYDRIKDNEKALAVYRTIEERLQALVDDKVQPDPLGLKYNENDELTAPSINNVVDAWYIGALDENFYYSEHNNWAFQTYIRRAIEGHEKEEDITL